MQSIYDEQHMQGFEEPANDTFTPDFDDPFNMICEIDERERIENEIPLINDDYLLCCEKVMCANDGIITCSVCGSSKPFHGDININHAEAAIPHIQVSGSGAFRYRKMLHVSTRTDYNKLRDKYITDILDQMYNASKCKLVKEVLYTAKVMVLEIMKVNTYRTKVLKEVIAACLSYACKKLEQNRRDKEIAEFVGLETDGFSSGNAIVIYMASRGVIDIKPCTNPSSAFVTLALQRLGINNTQHFKFVMAIIKTCTKNNIAINSMNYSKCMGSIYLLTEQMYPNVSINTIVSNCEIHINTIERFCKEVKSRFSFFINIYKRYNIPIPSDISIQLYSNITTIEISPPIRMND